MNNKAKSTVEKRLKVITKTLKVNKEAWRRADKIKTNMMRRHPSRSNVMNEWYSPYEKKDAYKRAKNCIRCSVKREIALQDERKFLNGLVTGKMIDFDQHNWDYEGEDVDLLSMDISPPKILEDD